MQKEKSFNSEPSNRTDKLLALLLLQSMKDATQAEKAVQLSIAGFTPGEIAQMLSTTGAVISQHLYAMRTKKTKKKSG